MEIKLIGLFEGVLAFIVVLGLSVIEGFREGLYYHEKCEAGHIENDYDEHAMFSVQRIMVGALLFTLFCLIDGMYFSAILSVLLLGPVFTLIHDSIYYEVRDAKKPGTYPDGWKSQSTTSKSKLDNAKIGKYKLSTPDTRLIAGIACIVLFFICRILIFFNLWIKF